MKIKQIVSSLFVGLLVGAASFISPAQAQTKLADNYFSTGATDAQHAGLWGVTNFVVVPTPSEGSGQAVITYLAVRSDTAGSGVAFWAPGTNALVMITNSVIATNKLSVNATNNFFVDGDHVLIQHKGGTNQPSYWEYNIASSVSGFVITCRSNTLARMEPGDLVWKLNQCGFIQCNNSTNGVVGSTVSGSLLGIQGPGIFASPRNQPLLLELKVATAAVAAIDAVSGRYVP
jgi:hypothetical protein